MGKDVARRVKAKSYIDKYRRVVHQHLSRAEFGGAGNSVFTQYAQLMKELGLKKPSILGEWVAEYFAHAV